MTERRSPAWASCFLVFAVLALCTGLYLTGVLLNLPSQAAEKFGPASPRHNPVDRYWLSFRVLQQEAQLTPPDPLAAPRIFEILSGESTADILQHLETAGLIRSSQALRDYLIYSGLDAGLQAGRHELSPAMSGPQIAQALQDQTPDEIVFYMLAGWRLEEAAAALSAAGAPFSPADFIRAARQPAIPPGLENEMPALNSPEGLLFPGEYRFALQVTPEEVLAAMLERYAANLNGEIKTGFANQGLSLYQGTILASIVEREVIIEDEMPLIASVYLNRLAINMKLDADPTVQYAVGYNDFQGVWWTNPLSSANLQLDSTYNTYLYRGLPPGPIASPSLAALRAVAMPASTPYYYFRARCDGSHRHSFAENYQQHLNNACP